jgi:hypothetical protein
MALAACESDDEKIVESINDLNDALECSKDQKCSDDSSSDTDTPETDTPETDTPETDTPETDTPETDTPETDNHSPVVNNYSIVMDQGESIVLNLSAIDIDGDQLNFEILTNPSNGELKWVEGELSYQADESFIGIDSFTFHASDGISISNIATVSIQVNETQIAEDLENTVRIFLMAGQSNMEGNNTKLSALEKLICHGDENFSVSGVDCGSYDVDDGEIETLFISEEAPLNDYYDPYSGEEDLVVTKLGSFLCKVGKITDANCEAAFDLTDRIFATVSDYYYNGEKYAYGNDAYKQMSTALGVSQLQADGHLNESIFEARQDVNVIQYQGKLTDGKLSFNSKKGPLTPNFGAKDGKYGPELSFGHYIGEHIDSDVLLLKVVQGGTDLRVDWKTPCSSNNAGNQLTAEELGQESLYSSLIQKANEIKNPEVSHALFPEYEEKNMEIAGFIWFQGWNDGLDDVNKENYETNLECMLEDLRDDLSLPELPVVIVQSHVGDPDNLVQVGQANVAQKTENTNLAITDDLSGYYHYDSAAQLVIGKRIAEQMIPMIKPND